MCANVPRHLIFLLYLFLSFNKTSAQNFIGDSLQNSLAASNPVKLYYDAIGENAHIYNGYEYFTPDRNIKGSPYYLSDSPIPSTFTYDESYYENFPVIYDQVRDLLVINLLGQNFKISLINSKLNGFTLRNHEFIRISTDSAKGIDLATGYYDRLYSGKSAVIVKRKKYVKEMQVYNTTNSEYMEDYHYFIFFEGKYVQVDSKSSVLSLFKSKKREIKSWLRKNKLNFKNDFEKTLIATSAYYDQLTS
jgi:hypothetical protein